jgi:hypothetical protein
VKARTHFKRYLKWIKKYPSYFFSCLYVGLPALQREQSALKNRIQMHNIGNLGVGQTNEQKTLNLPSS